MNTRKWFQYIPLVIAAAVTICPATAIAQTDWIFNDTNPVLAPGPGTWDAGGVFSPTVIQSGDSLKMWYAGAAGLFSSSTWAIGYATSTDGITWAKHGANPVMTGRPGEWDQPGVHSPSVILDGDTLRMWYVGGDGIDHANIGYATSVDGIHWNRHPTPVMETGPAGTWNEDTMGPGTVIKEDGVFKAWFFGGVGGILGANTDTKTGIGYATSPDGIIWTLYDDPATTAPPYHLSDPVLNHGEAGAWDANEMFTPHVLRTDAGGYQMWYSGWAEGQPGNYIGYATSPDEISWTKDPGNPIIRWDRGLGFPRVILDGEQYRMWYTQFRWWESMADIQYATSDLDTGLEVEDLPYGIEPQPSYPNPFTQETRIRYEVSTATHVVVRVYNVLGQHVRTLVDAVHPVGTYEAVFDGRSESGESIPSGVYFYRLIAQGRALTGGMILER